MATVIKGTTTVKELHGDVFEDTLAERVSVGYDGEGTYEISLDALCIILTRKRSQKSDPFRVFLLELPNGERETISGYETHRERLLYRSAFG